MDCIFCKIIAGEIPSYTVYENDFVKVFLDINPVSEGHMMIVPKKHFENMIDIDLETLTEINKVAKLMIDRLQKLLSCDGVTISQNNGHGQEVKHYHMHLIPRYLGDELKTVSKLEMTKSVEEVFKLLNA